MNCREFRRKHDEYIDDTLSGVDLDAMALHRSLCEPCAQLDTRVRRALLVARNLPSIQPSSAFGDRLQARLAAERLLMQSSRMPSMVRAHVQSHRRWTVSATAYVALAASVLAVAGLAGAVTYAGSRHDAIRLAPAVASRPVVESPLESAPAMVASMPVGMPLWPAVFVAQDAPYHFSSEVSTVEFLGH